MKKSKKQPPATQHKIQGVIIKCSDQHITVQPCPQRVQRLTELQNHIQSKSMSPEQARRLAGKCSFTTTHLFGRVGRSPLRALYMTRQVLLHNRQNQHTHTKTAIIALIEILAHCLPKTIPPSPNPIKTTIIYTDAFFSDGANTWRNSDFTEQDVRSSDFPPLLIHGTIPRKILQHFNLPATEHISTSLRHGQPLLTQPYIQLHDNDPECAAIHKGSGKRQLLNNLIGPHWAWLNRQQLTQFLRRVPS